MNLRMVHLLWLLTFLRHRAHGFYLSASKVRRWSEPIVLMPFLVFGVVADIQRYWAVDSVFLYTSKATISHLERMWLAGKISISRSFPGDAGYVTEASVSGKWRWS